MQSLSLMKLWEIFLKNLSNVFSRSSRNQLAWKKSKDFKGKSYLLLGWGTHNPQYGGILTKYLKMFYLGCINNVISYSKQKVWTPYFND